jgi:hypothetical protein
MGARAPRGKLGRSQIIEGLVGADTVVLLPGGFDLCTGMLEVEELVFVEALVAQLAIEALDVGVLGGFARSDEAMLDAVATPCSRRTSASGLPLWASRRMRTISSSLNRFFMVLVRV